MFLKELTIENTNYIAFRKIIFANQTNKVNDLLEENVYVEICAILQGVTTRGVKDLNSFAPLPSSSQIVCKYQIDECWGDGIVTVTFSGGKLTSIKYSAGYGFSTFQEDYPLREFSIAESGCNVFDCANPTNFACKIQEYADNVKNLSTKYAKYNLGEIPLDYAKRQGIPCESKIVDVVYQMLLGDFISTYCKKLQSGPRKINDGLYLTIIDGKFALIDENCNVKNISIANDKLSLQFASYLEVNRFWQDFHYFLTDNTKQPAKTYNVHNRFWKAYSPEPLIIQRFDLLESLDKETYLSLLTSANRQTIVIPKRY